MVRRRKEIAKICRCNESGLHLTSIILVQSDGQHGNAKGNRSRAQTGVTSSEKNLQLESSQPLARRLATDVARGSQALTR